MRHLILALSLPLVLQACGDSPRTLPHNEAPVLSPPATPAPTAIPPVDSLTTGVWMKGDLHVHSRHSNDSTNNPVAKIVSLAEDVGMDYLLISDHDNHVGGDVADNTWIDPEFVSDSVFLLYGAEWTTHRGHGTVMSAKPYDHQRFYDLRDARDAKLIAAKKELGVYVSANHPGGGDHFGFSYDLPDSMEVWNSAIWATNSTSVTIWDDMLKSGRRIAANGGSDSHHGYPDTPGNEADPNNIQSGGNNVGTPTTWVYAREKSAEAVVAALKAGRTSVSANPLAPRVEFTADLDRDGTPDALMGDNVQATGAVVNFRVQLAGGLANAPYMVTVTKDGAEFGSFTTSGSPPIASFSDTPDAAARSYYRVLVQGAPTAYPQIPASSALSGNMVGLSSAITFNFDPAF